MTRIIQTVTTLQMSFFSSVLDDTRRWISSITRAQLPSIPVKQKIVELRQLMKTPYVHSSHEEMLINLHTMIRLHTRQEFMENEFCRSGLCWKAIGFQHEDPESDFRGGGLLSLQNLNFFLAYHGEEASALIRRRFERSNGANYPWAAAGINITRMIASCFELVSSNGYTTVTVYTAKVYWDLLLLDPNAYDRLYVVAFRILDAEFTASSGSYMTFPTILQVRSDIH